MQVDKINGNKINIQPQQKAERTNSQPETLSCKNSIETSIYNQKGVQLPFCGFWSKCTSKIENECIELLENARHGKRKIFTPSEAKKPVQLLEQELAEEEIKQGHLIVYTSADSVLQIACNEDVFPIGAPFFVKKCTLSTVPPNP